MTELSPLDTGFMEMEDVDRHISLGIGAVAIIEGPPPTRAGFRAGLDRGLAAHGRLRQRVHRTPLDLAAPVWEDDPNFDPAHHIRWTALPEPGTERELRELVAEELAERFDRDHPLWDVVVVDNLNGGRWAMIVRAHHSMVDGISGITLFESCCDPVAQTSTQQRERRSHASRMTAAARIVRFPYTVPRFLVGAARTLAPVLYAAVTPTAESSLNGPIGRQRRYVVARTSLTEVREIAAVFDMTVNDVAVAAIAAAYRRLLLSRGATPAAGTLRILVPVSMRAADAKYIPDNRVSAMIVRLPIEYDQPVERLAAAHERIARHRSRGEAEAEKSVLALADRLPFAMVAWVFRTATRFPQRGVGALATNIPGPRHPLTLGGRKVVEIWPCIPIAMRVRTTVAILSYADQLNFGITGDYDTAPDLDELESGITTEISVLLAHARAR
ncbi:wax ester/triacylglycerol synthase family O-acyltransferase [Nocardia otitidiscaviarum]|uniref:wax ester/triacylglycerol synthase family O-acyltransferase n=1 Tax=Nocardia otitidiscaviarum TaxID=1823 RepID=UPI001895B9E3|nr:wax ester/triacylglycerol synthase family O-acyltransferase [Nocardia otitidiscaviarum]MBF6181451.1 wax ester/triacylglycerol synthase family O-acyltransferase [Nocardia otitidiscaviarum]